MNIWQRLAHRWFGWQYVMYVYDYERTYIMRAKRQGGLYHILKPPVMHNKFFLTRPTMAPSPAELQMFVSTVSYVRGMGELPQYSWRWAAMTPEIEAETLMQPETICLKEYTEVELIRKVTKEADERL